jgi:small-conductance mechanosensitive channel
MNTLLQLAENPIAIRAARATFWIFVILLVARLVRGAAARYIEDTDTRYRARKIAAAMGYFAAALVVLTTMSGQLGAFTVAIGAASAGIAFALQEVVASAAGFLALSFGGFYKVGNRVQLGGIVGDVIDIGVLRTTLMECGGWVKGDLYNGRIVRVANSFVFKEPVFNYSNDFPFLWDEITVPVKYGSDHAKAREILVTIADEVAGKAGEAAHAKWSEIVRSYRIEAATTAPMVTLVANDNWLEFTVRYVVDYKARRTTKDAMFRRILDAFDASGGKVAIASMTVHLVEWPPLDVRLAQSTEKG